MLRLTRGGSERPVTLMVSVQEEWCQTLLTRACCRQLSCPLILVVRTGLVDILSSLSLSLPSQVQEGQDILLEGALHLSLLTLMRTLNTIMAPALAINLPPID
jgi:hypothetical protein